MATTYSSRTNHPPKREIRWKINARKEILRTQERNSNVQLLLNNLRLWVNDSHLDNFPLQHYFPKASLILVHHPTHAEIQLIFPIQPIHIFHKYSVLHHKFDIQTKRSSLKIPKSLNTLDILYTIWYQRKKHLPFWYFSE